VDHIASFLIFTTQYLNPVRNAHKTHKIAYFFTPPMPFFSNCTKKQKALPVTLNQINELNDREA